MQTNEVFTKGEVSRDVHHFRLKPIHNNTNNVIVQRLCACRVLCSNDHHLPFLYSVPMPLSWKKPQVFVPIFRADVASDEVQLPGEPLR